MIVLSCLWLPTVPVGQTDKQTLQRQDGIGITTNPVENNKEEKNLAFHVTEIKITKIVSSVVLMSARNFTQNLFDLPRRDFCNGME